MRQDGVSYDPPGCYFEGEKLKFNAKATNKGACSSIKNNFSDVCVCKQNTNKYSNEVYQDLGMGDWPVHRLFPPCALISHAQGSSGVVDNMLFVWRGHTKRLTTRARPSPDLVVWLE